MRGDGELGVARTESGADIESPQVPRTDDLVTDQIPLGQRSAAVRTGVVGSEKSMRSMGNGNAPLVDLHSPDAAKGKVGQAKDFGKQLVHRRRTLANGLLSCLVARSRGLAVSRSRGLAVSRW